jgi:hypothetical protein
MSCGKKVINFVREVLRESDPELARSEAELKAGEHIYKLVSKFCNET